MKLSAIIAEYNPLHKGHQYLIQEAKARTNQKLLVIMSGNFVQRGTPAIYNKWVRTHMALQAGADIVLELPALYATASAEGFAVGAISILDALGSVDNLVFGTEAGSIRPLEELATLLVEEPLFYKEKLSEKLQTGASFPVARRYAASSILGEPFAILLDQPNNILAIEYLQAIRSMHAKIKPIGILRQGDGYHEEALTGTTFSSATAIRGAIKSGASDWETQVPYANKKRLPQAVFEESAFPYLIYLLRTMQPDQLAAYRDVREGFEHALLRAAKQAQGYVHFIELCKSKRYTRVGIQRICMNILLGITNELSHTIQNESLYARVLGIKKESLEILSSLNARASIPVVTSPVQHLSTGLSLDAKASDVYGLLESPIAPAGQDYTKRLFVL